MHTYNAEDVRISNVCCDEEDTVYTYDTNCRLSQLLQKTTNNVTTKYVYGLGLIGEETGGAFKTYHFDYRGSTVAITDIYGNTTDTFEYDTYGNLLSRTGTSDTIFMYNGRDGVVTDKNGLIYMRARYYSPELKRFVNADILKGDISDSTSLNRYAYANGNPVSNVDPLGLSAERGNESQNNNNGISNFTRNLIRLLIGNPICNFATKIGLFKDLFRKAGFVRTKDLHGTYIYISCNNGLLAENRRI